MKLVPKKLIIWDFDGVIADTEVIWQKIRLEKLKEHFGISWTLEEANWIIGGINDTTKVGILQKLGYDTTSEFWDEVHRMDDDAINVGFERTPYIDDIFDDKHFKHCIATGDTLKHTIEKCRVTGISKWFEVNQIFCAEMVKHGKPEPDLFLFAAKKMGVAPEACLVIEDSTAGLIAAQKAGMTPIAFSGSTLNNNPEYSAKVKNMDIEYVFSDMREIYNLIKGMI